MKSTSTRPLRLAYARIAQETHAFSPVTSTLDDFRRFHWLEGDALARACGRWRAEVPGMIRNAELSGFVRAARGALGRRVELVPLLSAWAVPSGPLAADANEALRGALADGLRRAGPLDGCYLALHGAMRARGADREPEAGFLAAAREVLGPDRPLAVSYDLHGHLTPAKVDPATLTVAYRTNPHRDLASTGARAGALLARAVTGEVRPTSAWRSLPLVLGGGLTIDFLSPMRPLFRRLRALEREPRVLSTSLFMCHPFNDAPDLGWSVHATTDGDPALADAVADELADRAWAVRHEQPPEFLAPEAGIAAAREATLARRLGTVCVVDTSDVVGAGSTGENTHLVRALLEHGAGMTSYVPLRDPVAVAALWDRAPGDAVALEVGGRIDPATNPPVAVAGKLRSRATTTHFGRAVVLDLGHVQLVLTELPPLPLKPRFYGDLGLDCWRADLVVVKSFFHYRIYFLAHNRRSIPIRTRGLTDFERVLELDFADAVHPKDPVACWRPADARRRGLAPAPAARAPVAQGATA